MTLTATIAAVIAMAAWLGITAPPGPQTEAEHLRECWELGWIFYDEMTRLEALEHG